ncbi:MAG: hypothetical protein J5779_01825 [Clostridia bacterium]|nr:hypothetical protein [Clostridia bacterium]
MMSFLHLNCKFEAKVEFWQNDNKLFEVCSTSNLQNEIDLQVFDLESFKLKIFPLGKTNNVAYTANVESDGENLISKNRQVKVFNLPQNHFYFIIFPLAIKSSNFEGFDKIEIEGEKIKTLCVLNTIKKRGEVKIFEPFGDKVKQTESYFVNFKIEQAKNANLAITLLKFFQDLYVLDIKSSKEYLTNVLSQKLTENSLKTFFGAFDECALVNYYDDFSVILFNFENNFAKVFGANFENNLISNIYEIE